jgi:hypothetical protein
VRTLNRAFQLMRNGYPDWMLLERGAVFNDRFPSWKKSGRSASEPMVVSTYGPAPQRPVIRTGSDSGLLSADNQTRRHLRFVGFEMFPHERTDEVPVGVSFIGPVSDVLFEDLHIHGYATGVIVQASSDTPSSNVRVRRSAIANSWATGQHSQGMYFSNINGLTIEECVLDRNGWNPRFEERTRTIFNHNVYVQQNVTNFRFRDNFVSRASSHGLQARNGGDIRRNVFWENPINILWGNEGGRDEYPVRGAVSDNVLLDTVDMYDQGRGWGVIVENVEQGRIDDNIFAGSTSNPSSTWGVGITGPSSAPVFDTVVEGNVFYNWYNGFSVLRDTARDVEVIGNTFAVTRSNEVLIDHRVLETRDNVRYQGNKYFQQDSTTRWFSFDRREMNLTEWTSEFEPQASVIQAPSSHFPDASWTLDRYAGSKGYSSAEAMIEAMRQQRRGDWRASLTTGSIVDEARAAFGLPAIP